MVSELGKFISIKDRETATGANVVLCAFIADSRFSPLIDALHVAQ